MQVADIPGLSNEINDIRKRTAAIVDGEIIPNENILRQPGEERRALFERLRARVKSEGLWAPHLPKEYGGMGIGFLSHAYMNEVLAWSPFSNPIFGVVAPNSGNEVLLIRYGTEEQKKRWLEPLIRGEIESCFSMTEPENPGSDPYAIQTRAVFAIVVCRTEDDTDGASARNRLTQIIVPTDTPGFKIVRSVPVWGHEGGDHCEIIYDNVRVPLTNQLGQRGSGHQAAQERLGAGRVFHCMNCVGQMWRAFDMMARRAMTRQVHGGLLETKQFIQGFLADSYIDIQAARLMTIHTAHKIDAGLDARTDISAIKVFVPEALSRVVDRAIQVHGALGVSSDTPLEAMYRGARTLRIADGPDEVHRIVIAKNVLKRYHDGLSWDFGV